MKKNIKIFIAFITFLALGACESYLDKEGANTDLLTEDEVWQDRYKINSIAMRLYDCTEWLFETRYVWDKRQSAGAGKSYGNISEASGESILTRDGLVIGDIISGNWIQANENDYSNPDFWMCWEDSWECIYVSNSILSRIDDVPETVLSKFDRLQIKGEAYLFRAWGYYEINKRWGAMHYFTEPLLSTDDYNLERPDIADNREKVINDLDSAIVYLQEYSYLNDPVYMGRMGKAAAMGLKSRALTTYASPNFLPDHGSDPELWKRAAKAAWEVIVAGEIEDKIGLYNARGVNHDDFPAENEAEGNYTQMFHTNMGTVEDLWPRYYEATRPVNTFRVSWLWGAVDGYQCSSPSQELVDRFEMADGTPIELSANYDDQDPYSNRDPRFYHDILYHGSLWAKTTEQDTIDMRTSPLGADRSQPNGGYSNSQTGYICRKRLPPQYNTKAYNNPKYINSAFIRMGEMYLNYAEAVNEAYKDPQAVLAYDGVIANRNAVQILNELRDRSDVVPVRSEYTSDYSKFQERVRNEFYVELCFEYHIWHDQLRWRTAEEYDGYDFHGMLIIEEGADDNKILRYERFPIHRERKFDKSRQYRYPLRTRDLQICNKLEQNEGWEE